MALAFRRIRESAPTACVSVETFSPANADDTMAEICRVVDWFRLGLVYRDPEDAMLEVLARLERSQMFGEPVPPPKFSAELSDRLSAYYARAAE